MLALLACSCSAPFHTASTNSSPPTDLESTIARLQQADPDSPAVLNARLNFAKSFLSGPARTCAERLERAQEQLGSVDASPKTLVMYPDGWATVFDLEYRLHLARAECRAADRKDELRTAVQAAQRAVELYRNMFDYHSMVIMQFDASVTLHDLGETAAATAAFEAAIDMDREYGFKDDAADNYRLLLTWRAEPVADAQVASLMQDFPSRQATFKFGWRASDARITMESRRSCLLDGQIVTSRAADAFDRHIVAGDDGGWNVSYLDALTQYEPGVWPTMQSS